MTLYRIMGGGNTTKEQLERICAATDGVLSPADFFTPSPRKEAV